MSSSTPKSELLEDCSPLSQACIKALTDRFEDKRKYAAIEIEKMTVDFSMSNNLLMINRLIDVLGGKFCLSPHTNPNTRKGGLMGLAAVMVGYKNGSASDPPPEIIEEVVRPILTCFLDSDSRVRYYACESLYNVTKVAKAAIIPLFDSVFDLLSKAVADPDMSVRSGAEVLDRLLKDIIVEQQTYDISDYLPKFEEYIYTKNPFTRMFIISWIRLIDSKIGLISHRPQLLDGIFNCLCDSTEEIRASTLNLLSGFLNGDTPAGEQSSTNLSRFIQALCKTFRDKEVFFEEQGTFIILNLCNMIKPETIYKSFAEILKDENTDVKFAYNLVQRLNQILLTTQPLQGLRSRLGNDEDPEMKALFHSLYHAWCHSPIAVLTLCLLTNRYRHASEIVSALAQADINLDLLSQIDWVIQLIESPVFASLRMRLLDSNHNEYLLQSLYGLLMILPQSEAYKRLSHRLDQVHKFLYVQQIFKVQTTSNPASQAAHKSSSSSGTGGGGSISSSGGVGKEVKKTGPTANLQSLMQHYHKVQSQRAKLIRNKENDK